MYPSWHPSISAPFGISSGDKISSLVRNCIIIIGDLDKEADSGTRRASLSPHSGDSHIKHRHSLNGLSPGTEDTDIGYMLFFTEIKRKQNGY
jgi:hypothetical protein